MPEPFVSHDGVDPKGFRAEVWVETGEGIVAKIDRSGSSDNYQIVMKCERLKHPVQAWLRSDDPLFPKAQELLESGRVVAYRIECKRKPGIPRETPITELRASMDLARDNTVKVMAGLDGKLAGEALTDPSEDPVSGTYSAVGHPQPAKGQAGGSAGGALGVDAALAGLTAARQGGLSPTVVDACTALALAAGANIKQVQTAGVTAERAERPTQQRGRSIEATAWNEFNTDGRVNLGSYVAHAALSAVDKAFELLVERNARIAEGTDAVPNQPKDEQVGAVARLLLGLADRVQVAAYDGGKADRNAASHVRARGLVYSAIGRCPIPIRMTDEETEAFKVREIAWREEVVAQSLGRWKIAFAVMAASEPAPAAAPANTTAPAALTAVPNAPASEPTQAAPAQAAPAQAAPAQAAPAQVAPAALSVVPNVPAVSFDAGTISFTPTVTNLVEGQPGYEAPTEETLVMLGAMAQHPDVSDPHTVGSLLAVVLGQKFARHNHGPALVELISHYRSLGEDGPMTFAKDAMLAHERVSAPQAS